jgi:hypothetical protein
MKNISSIKQQANKVLDSIQIIPLLAAFGEVQIVGSYALDVMVALDIDIHVVTEEYTKTEFIKNIHEFIENHDNIAKSFISHKRGFEEFATNLDVLPLGTYVGINVVYEGKFWKFDIWYYEQGDDNGKAIETTLKYKKLLDQSPEKRHTILTLKQQTYDTKERKYVNGFSGVTIYEGVLEKGYTTVLDFDI